MKIDTEGNITAFCCERFDKATLQPNKSISIQLEWKDHFLDKPHPVACSMISKSGRSIDVKTGMVDYAGFDLVPIKECPFCKKEITFVFIRPILPEGAKLIELKEIEKQGKIKLV